MSEAMPAASAERSLITFDNATLRLRDRWLLKDTNWTIGQGESWAVIGPNGAGKSTLLKAIIGDVPAVKGRIIRHVPEAMPQFIGAVSAEMIRRIIDRTEGPAGSRHFTSGDEIVLTVRDYIDGNGATGSLPLKIPSSPIDLLNVGGLLDRELRFLSSGEFRKAAIARALAKNPRLLVLDEPFDGVDGTSAAMIRRMLNDLIGHGIQIILVTHRPEDLPPLISHVLALKDCRIFAKGRKDDLIADPQFHAALYESPKTAAHPARSRSGKCTAGDDSPAFLVAMKNATVRYGEIVVLNDLAWTMKRGEHWAIVGPNGSGKSILLSLINGDNPQAYANNIVLFGRQRGAGESLWDIKRYIGCVSSELQLRYPGRTPLEEVVLSGYFDSLGLFRRPTAEQRQQAHQWLNFIGLASKARVPFGHLSSGQQRLILIARAAAKSPALLTLDEPLQGLDRHNRTQILSAIDAIAADGDTSILYVGHRQNDMPSCITRILRLPEGQCEYCTRPDASRQKTADERHSF
ncbi:MAG: ATP-binding cassette domain-containing protein [Deltaproteobacteria bacterium]|nr:ATP-binding cassette domain-containing protein [Deltaproteobacteria bacterium]